jgi:hypothetical protein
VDNGNGFATTPTASITTSANIPQVDSTSACLIGLSASKTSGAVNSGIGVDQVIEIWPDL